MKRRRRSRLVFYTVYLLILVVGAYVVYRLIPPDILEEIRRAYFSGGDYEAL